MGVRRRSSQAQRKKSAAKDAAESGASTEATSKAARGSSSKDETPNIVPSFEEVFAAVDSLYADDLKPFGRILRKRVAERATAAAGVVLSSEENLPDVDIKHLRATCEESDALTVEPEEGGDWSALIVGRLEAFVNVYSPIDLYPPHMWDTSAAYFQALEGADDMYLPGGRYSCAQALQARELPFLQGRSLGQVCHIVQLAISQKKQLGYLNGSVVPYARSQSMVKEQCAQFNAPCTAPAKTETQDTGTTTAGSGLVLADWATARQCLRDILDNAAVQTESTVGMVPLSNVKRLFRSRFHTELSETMLGHSKLSELLQDERFGDICNVQLQGHGYIVVQVEPQPICLADTLPVYGGDTPASEPRRIELMPEQEIPLPEFCTEEPLTLDMDEAGVFVESSPSPKVGRARWPAPTFSPSTDGFVSSLVQRTFIQVGAPPPPTPPPNARRRASSVPKDVGSDQGLWEPQIAGFMPLRVGNQTERTESTIDSTAGSGVFDGAGARAPASPTPSAELSQSCTSDQSALDDPVKVLLRECNLNASEPMKIGDSGSSDMLDAGTGDDGEPRRRLQFCPDEPLALEEAGVFLESAPRTATPTSAYNYSSAYNQSVPRWPCFSPSLPFKDGRVGSIALSKVHNTFIHSPLPPPTPLRVGASRRSRSLPKNVGSDKNPWEATCQALGCSQMAFFKQQREFNAGDCGPTPSVYADYIGPDMPCSLASPSPFPFSRHVPCSPGMFVPPSPALTASPTYCCTRRPGLPATQRPLYVSPSPMSQDVGPLGLGGSPQNVICLADLLC